MFVCVFVCVFMYLVCEYNALTKGGSESSKIGITEALDPHNIEGQITEFSSVCNTVMTGRKRQIMDAYLSLCRRKWSCH